MQSINRLIEKSKNSHSGFTIVELLMVIGIISVLITITISAVSGSMRRARAQKANALCTLVEQGAATYYAQNEEWPINFDGKSKNAEDGGSSVKSLYVLSGAEVREVVKALVEATRKGNPVMDVSGLYVSTSKGEGNDVRGYGQDFMSAVRGTKKNPEGISLSKMYFGYPDEATGHFRRFKMTYSFETDRLSVSR